MVALNLRIFDGMVALKRRERDTEAVHTQRGRLKPVSSPVSFGSRTLLSLDQIQPLRRGLGQVEPVSAPVEEDVDVESLGERKCPGKESCLRLEETPEIGFGGVRFPVT